MKPNPTVLDLLRGQGFGSRQECLGLIHAGQVEAGWGKPGEDETLIFWRPAAAPDERLSLTGLLFRVGNRILPYRDPLFLAFHKPAGVECSRVPGHHRSVFEFFPAPFLRRNLQTVGRLDADTTGLLLLTDSGAFNHALTSPRRHVPKTYRVESKHPISPEQMARLGAGVLLRGEGSPTLPAQMTPLSERICELSIAEGKYHQVKRMFAAVGNRVEKIHRTAVGPVRLEGSLAEGAWRYLREEELRALGFGPPG